MDDPFYGTPQTAVGPVWPHDPADEPLLKLRDELDRLRTENAALHARIAEAGAIAAGIRHLLEAIQ